LLLLLGSQLALFIPSLAERAAEHIAAPAEQPQMIES
jgi:hypothetical protein